MLLKKTSCFADPAQDEDIMIFLLFYNELESLFDRFSHNKNTEYTYIS